MARCLFRISEIFSAAGDDPNQLVHAHLISTAMRNLYIARESEITILKDATREVLSASAIDLDNDITYIASETLILEADEVTVQVWSLERDAKEPTVRVTLHLCDKPHPFTQAYHYVHFCEYINFIVV